MVRRADDEDEEREDGADDDLEDEFPLGDGTVVTEADVTCPYCFESMSITLDPGSGSHQQYVEDCQVCCRPWTVFVTYDEDGEADVAIEAADEGDNE